MTRYRPWPILELREHDNLVETRVGVGYAHRVRYFYLPNTCSREAALRLVTPAFAWLVEQERLDGYIDQSIAGNLMTDFQEHLAAS